MNHERLYNRIVASFATGTRGDFQIADFQKLDRKSAHVLIQYNHNLGRPSGNDIETYFHKTFEGKVTPLMASCSIKPNAISIVAQLNVPTRPLEDSTDKAKMTPVIAGLMYLDNQLNDYWSVETEEDGKKVLSKKTDENIEQIIASRRNRMFVTQASNISLASVAAARDLLGAGDKVMAYNRSECKPFEITAKIQGGFRGKFEGSESEVVLASEKVVDLQQQALDKAPNEAAKLKKYFEEAYGDKKYAQLLVKS